MRRKILFAFVIALVVLSLLSGCGKSSGSTQSAGSTSPTTQATSANDVQMQALIMEKLQGHHSIDIVLQVKHTREEWNATMDRMIARGAPISEQEKQQIIDWLLSRNP
jgi:uncharacterized protein YceK